jgi:hypothetical protein
MTNNHHNHNRARQWQSISQCQCVCSVLQWCLSFFVLHRRGKDELLILIEIDSLRWQAQLIKLGRKETEPIELNSKKFLLFVAFCMKELPRVTDDVFLTGFSNPRTTHEA